MDYYAILEIKYGATPEEIKKAFFRLAKIHHPDKGGSEAKFKEINNAYQELSKNPHNGNSIKFRVDGGFNTTPKYSDKRYDPYAAASTAHQHFNASMQDFVNRANAMKQQQENLRNQQRNFQDFHFTNGGTALDGHGRAYRLVKNPKSGNYEWQPMW